MLDFGSGFPGISDFSFSTGFDPKIPVDELEVDPKSPPEDLEPLPNRPPVEPAGLAEPNNPVPLEVAVLSVPKIPAGFAYSA